MAVEIRPETVQREYVWDDACYSRTYQAIDPLRQSTARRFRASIVHKTSPDCQFEAMITLSVDAPPVMEISGGLAIASRNSRLIGVQTDNLLGFEKRLQRIGYQLTPIPYSQ
jgi:hypothetical protein